MVILLVTAAPVSAKDIKKDSELTIKNKSDEELRVALWGREDGAYYYFTVPWGDREFPAEESWTIDRDEYYVQVWYVAVVDLDTTVENPWLSEDTTIELAPCIVGYDNDLDDYEKYRLDANRGSVNLTITECGYEPPNRGDPAAGKYKWQYYAPDKEQFLKVYPY